MTKSLWMFGFLLAISAYSQAVEIVSINVPQSIENGTVSSLVLDCDYNVPEDEKNGLVVKWFLRDIPAPVYQWIPGRKPQDLGLLKGKVNLEYRASEDYHKKYRSLNILNPTTELSGEYRCHVATLEDEKESKATMTVYVLPKSVELWTVKPNPESVNVTCRVEGVYPEAKLELFREYGPRTRAPVSGAVVQTSWRDGKYDITLSKTLEDRTLLSETTFDCVVTIPGTDIQKTRRLTYLPSHVTTVAIEPETESTTSITELVFDYTVDADEEIELESETAVPSTLGYLEEMSTTTEFIPLLETESEMVVDATLAHLSTTTSGPEDEDGYTSPRSSQRSAELSEEVEEIIEKTHDRRHNAPIPSERSQDDSFSPNLAPSTLFVFLLSLIHIFAR